MLEDEQVRGNVDWISFGADIARSRREAVEHWRRLAQELRWTSIQEIDALYDEAMRNLFS